MERQNKGDPKQHKLDFIGSETEYDKPFPHIMGRGKKKPGGLCHKTPPHLEP